MILSLDYYVFVRLRANGRCECTDPLCPAMHHSNRCAFEGKEAKHIVAKVLDLLFDRGLGTAPVPVTAASKE